MKTSPPLSIYKKIAGVFILLTIVLVFIIFYYSLTYAFIVINPTDEIVSADFNLLVTEDPSAADNEKGVFTGVLIDQELEANGEFSSSGKATFKNDMGGVVSIINKSSRNQPLVATTRLLTSDGVLFRIKDSILVPAGEKIETSVYQDDNDVPVEINIGDKLTIPGLSKSAQELIYGEVASDFSGDETEVSIVTKEDLDNSTDALISQIKSKIISTVPEGNNVAITIEVIDKQFSNLAGDQSDKFTGTIRARVQGTLFEKLASEQYVRNIFEMKLSKDKNLREGSKLDITYSVDDVDLVNEIVQIIGKATSTVTLREQSQVLSKDKLVNLKEDEAKAFLENMKEISSVEISFFPFWINKLPAFEDHILIEIK